MSINVELALVLSLFIIGALILAIDNLLDGLYRRLTRWIQSRRSPPTAPQPVLSSQKKRHGEPWEKW